MELQKSYQDTLNDLVDKLKELFQMDQADLDFGIYRVMKAKHNEIDKFLTKELLPTVKATLQAAGKSQDKQNELDELVNNLRNAGVDPDTSPKVKELKELLAGGSGSVESDARDIFSDLITFFSRYYSGGDFMSLRRYKKDTYSPLSMNGEEVKLHWANADQYYIKSSENLTNYAFVEKFNSDKDLKVKFELVAASTEQNNNKAQEGERIFKLSEDAPFTYSEDSKLNVLTVKFEYQLDTKKTKQKDVNAAIIKHIGKLDEVNGIDSWLEIKEVLLSLRSTNANQKRTLLEKHLADYTAKNKFDYFIHKDLRAFLNSELDHFIKAEIVKLDDIIPKIPTELSEFGLIITKQAIVNEHQLKKAAALKLIAEKVIAFLSQLEDFQKKLWLKKKFVLNTNWLISLNRFEGNDELISALIRNEKQIKEWAKLLRLDESTLVNDINKYSSSEILSESKYQNLVLNTVNFSLEEKRKILEEFDDLDSALSGTVINSENFQAMNLLSKKYKNSFDFVYIDPPYNTGNDGFLYKDSFKHSAWLSLMNDRLAKSSDLISQNGNYFLSIDDNENNNLKSMMNKTFGEDSFEAQIIVQSNKRGQTYQNIAKTHEYLLCYKVSDDSVINELPKEAPVNSLSDNLGPYEMWELRNRNPKFGKFNRPNLFYPIYVDPNNRDTDGYAKVSINRLSEHDIEVFPLNSEGGESCWRWGAPKLEEELSKEHCNVVAKIKRDGNWNIYEKARKGTTKAKSIWTDTSFISEQGTVELGNLGFTAFGFPKPTALVKEALKIGADKNSTVLDFFGGSGTTAQAVLDLNSEDNGNRKFCLIEMGNYVNSIVIPRIIKNAYSSIWKSGKPHTARELYDLVEKDEKNVIKALNKLNGIEDKEEYLFQKQKLETKLERIKSHKSMVEECVKLSPSNYFGKNVFVKYQELESYEDVLSNIELKQSNDQQSLLGDNSFAEFNEQYILKYMLDVESRSKLINSNLFDSPFDAEIKVVRNNEAISSKLDLFETFNYLLGLKVKTVRQLKGVYEVVGTTPSGDKCLILWRDIFETNNDQLDDWFKKQNYSSRDMEFDLIYVNGDNNLPNLKTSQEHWKVQLIETEFYKLMFDVNGL